MDNYEKLLGEINEFINSEKPNLENTNDEVISAYDLYIKVKKELSGLNKLSQTPRQLAKKVDFNSLLTLITYDEDVFQNSRAYVGIYGDASISQITFYNTDLKEKQGYNISVKKDKGASDIYIDKPLDNQNKSIYKFIKKNYCLIIEILSQIEEYTNILDKISFDWLNIQDEENSMDIQNKLFDISLTYNLVGKVDAKIFINHNHPLASEFYKNYLNKQTLSKYANENKEAILKRILISPHQISDGFEKIYNHKNKEDQKVKYIRWWN